MSGQDTARRPRWLVFTQDYPPEVGAPQIRLRAVVKELNRHHIAVEVLTAMPNYPTGRIQPGYQRRWRMRDVVDGIPVRRTWVYAGAGRSVFVRLANYLSFTATGALAALTGPRPDVLFVEGQPLSLGIVALLMKWLRGVPYIYNVPDLQVDVARQLGFLKNERALRAAAAIERFIARQAWKVSTVTHRFMEHFRSEGVPAGQVTFLPNGADTDFLRPAAADRALLERFNVGNRKVFLYVGTFAYYHGLHTILDAAEILRDRRDVMFLMIGHGSERPLLERAARERGLTNVVFGDSPYEERDRLYSIAYASFAIVRDIAVASQMRPAKIFPSLSCGVPVIYSGRGETTNLLASGPCGVSVPPENPNALAAAVADLIAHPDRRDAYGAAGRALVERDFAWSTIVTRWLAEIGVSTAEPRRHQSAAETIRRHA